MSDNGRTVLCAYSAGTGLSTLRHHDYLAPTPFTAACLEIGQRVSPACLVERRGVT